MLRDVASFVRSVPLDLNIVPTEDLNNHTVGCTLMNAAISRNQDIHVVEWQIGNVSPNPEYVRWHEDWWGQCRTCRHWQGNRVNGLRGYCSHSDGPLNGTYTCRMGNCPKWDTFDMDAAEVVMQKDESP